MTLGFQSALLAPAPMPVILYPNQTYLWADLVLVMEHRHKKQITRQYQNLDLPRIIVLDIPDDYPYMADELVEMLRESVENLLQSFDN